MEDIGKIRKLFESVYAERDAAITRAEKAEAELATERVANKELGDRNIMIAGVFDELSEGYLARAEKAEAEAEMYRTRWVDAVNILSIQAKLMATISAPRPAPRCPECGRDDRGIVSCSCKECGHGGWYDTLDADLDAWRPKK